VKIAVIDTGLDNKMIEQIYKYKDCITTPCNCGTGGPCDDTPAKKTAGTAQQQSVKTLMSHGDKSVRFVQTIHDDAQIHVARAFANETADDSTPGFVAKVGKF
jgi:hypothetical protein